jgi:hypothetical protein
VREKCAKALPRILTTKELAAASRQRTLSHFAFFFLPMNFFYQK